ncbi:MAG: hypothetical protein A4E63_00384 [Syntrophorhabdus sp. PtaU1.Bin050]|nr:MAG: hypothetical protein A4E63_00384 [Syntrophorhabdus sp. PtaU1.Bin050]
MQCDKEREFNGYLEGVLIDGAKSFLFRSRVRTLLGLPEWDGDNRIFSSPSLPVGFKYGRSLPRGEPFMGTPYSYTRAGEVHDFGGRSSRYEVSEETDPNIFASGKTFPYEPGKDVHRRTSQNNEAFEDKTTKDDNPAKGAEFSCHRRSEPFENPIIAGLAEKYEAARPAHGPVVSPETGRGQPGSNPPSGSLEIFTGNPVGETEGKGLAGSAKDGLDAASDTAMKMETTIVEIPGFSRTRQGVFFPLFVEEMPQPEAERYSAESVPRPLLRGDSSGSPKVTIEGKDRFLTDADDGKKGQAERGLNNMTLRGLHVPDNRPAETDPPPARYEREPDQQIEQASFGHSSAIGSGGGRFETHGVKVSGVPSDPLGGEEGGGLHGIGSVHAGAMDRIEQIHRALREQAMRTSAEHKRRDEDPISEQPAMEMPPLPPPNVIIARVPSQQPRVPRAFWQRRHLGHFHLRPLR